MPSLCFSRAQYINVLSDETRCPPASIINMAGLLGMEACGHNIFRYDNGGPTITINKGFECAKMKATKGNTENRGFWDEQGNRLPWMDDILVASQPKNWEKLWCSINWHGASFKSCPGGIDDQTCDDRAPDALQKRLSRIL